MLRQHNNSDLSSPFYYEMFFSIFRYQKFVARKNQFLCPELYRETTNFVNEMIAN